MSEISDRARDLLLCTADLVVNEAFVEASVTAQAAIACALVALVEHLEAITDEGEYGHYLKVGPRY